MPTPPSTASSLDPQLVNLAKAIRTNETSEQGDFTKRGASGEYGAYQWLPSTWAAKSQAAGVNVPLEQSTPEQQNEVAYKTLQTWKQQHPDWNVGNFASAWNAGEGDPNAYQENKKGTNAEGVQYDTPAYAKHVAETYQKLKGQSQGQYAPPTPPGQPQSPSTTPDTGYAPPQPPPPPQTVQGQNVPNQESFMGDLSQGNYGGALVQGGKGLLNPFLGPAESLGTHLGEAAAGATAKIAGALGNKGLEQHINDKFNAQGTEVPTFTGTTPKLQPGLKGAEQIGGDALQTGLLASAPATGGSTVLGRLGVNAGLGAAFGAGSALSQGGSWQDVLKQAGVGAAVGGVVGGAGELLSKAAQYLPQRIARTFIPGLNPETAQYAVDRGLGAPKTMLEASNANLTKVGSALGAAIKEATGPAGEEQFLPGKELFQHVADQLPDAGLTGEQVAANIKKLVPLKSALVDKLFNGSATLEDLQSLNSAIGKATFKTVFDDPAVKAGKDIGNMAYHAFGNIIKSAAPEAAPLYDEYSKELQLNGALQKAIRRGEKSRFFTLRDLVALFAGSPLGLPGMAATYGIEKAAVNPTVNLKAGGLLSKLASPAAQSTGQFLKGPAIQAGRGAVNGLLGQ